MIQLVIIGAGGLAREVFDLANICYANDPEFSVKGFLSDGKSNISDLGYPQVLGKVAKYKVQETDKFFCAIGNVLDRKKTAEIIAAKGGEFINLIHPTAVLSPSVKLGKGVAIKTFCVLASDVSIGDHSYLQSSVIMGHDVKIGSYCHINSFSFFAGCSEVHDLATINAGARLVQNTIVGRHATIGIGSVVIRNVSEETTVFGNPARRIEK